MKRVVCTVLLCVLFSCKPHSFGVYRVDAKTQTINQDFINYRIDDYIKPYRDSIERDLSRVLCYNLRAMMKNKNHLNIPLGNMMADATKKQIDSAYFQKTGKHIDFVLLNYGGIRASLPQGNITTREAFDIMPFENEAVVVTLKGNQLREMAQYLALEKLPHPLSEGVQLVLDDKGDVQSFLIEGKPIKDEAEYRVVTSDYLFRGGDRMYFFQPAIHIEPMNYTLRKVLIDYFTTTDTLRAVTDNRFYKIK